MIRELNGKKLAEIVLRSTGGAAIKNLFKIDTINYSWVELYLKDMELRGKIISLQQKIKEIQAQPIDRDELKKTFESALKNIKNERLAWLRDVLISVQNRKGSMINSHRLKRGDFIPELGLSQKDINELFMELPLGVKQSDIEKEVKEIREEIKKIEDCIAAELSPTDRFIYEDDGSIIPYPHGCRWTQFVQAWKMVASRFQKPVNIEGTTITNEQEITAYKALEFGNL